MSEVVLAIDPGERVGFATGIIADGELEVTGQGVAPLQDFAIKLGKAIANYDTVVYETWRLRPDMARKMVGNDFQPVQLIGVIRYLGWLHPTVRLKSLGPNTKVTGHKVMPPVLRERLAHSTEEHDQDALALLSYYWWDRYE